MTFKLTGRGAAFFTGGSVRIRELASQNHLDFLSRHGAGAEEGGHAIGEADHRGFEAKRARAPIEHDGKRGC